MVAAGFWQLTNCKSCPCDFMLCGALLTNITYKNCRVSSSFVTEYVQCTKEYKEEAQCVQKGGGRMLVFVICGFIKNVLPNSYFIFQIPHVKSFKMMHFICLYFNYSVRYSWKCIKEIDRIEIIILTIFCHLWLD